MKAAILDEVGGVPRYGDFAEPDQPDDAGAEVIDVIAAALNPSDIASAAGQFFVAAPPVPYVVGREAIAQTSDGRRRYFARTVPPYGAFAQRSVVTVAQGIEVPDGLDPGLALCFGTSGVGWLALEVRAQLRHGETVVVLGATGIVGQIAVQAAKLLGAGRVVGVGRDPQTLARLTDLGADAVVAIDPDTPLTGALTEACEGGFDVAVDALWGAPLAQALPAAKPSARIVNLGQAAGPTTVLPSGLIRGKALSLLGLSNVNTPPATRVQLLTKMMNHAASGDLRVEVESTPLSDVGDVWQRQSASPHVKLVVIP